MRNQVVALIAAALESSSSPRWSYVTHTELALSLDKPVKYQDAPDLFCLDFTSSTDWTGRALAAPSVVKTPD